MEGRTDIGRLFRPGIAGIRQFPSVASRPERGREFRAGALWSISCAAWGTCAVSTCPFIHVERCWNRWNGFTFPLFLTALTGIWNPEELPELEEGEFLLYTNYFGIKEKYVDRLASRYGGRLVVDNALALYSPARPGVASLYSPRKFSGLPDGGIAVMDADQPLPEPEERDESLPDAAFLLGCLEHGPERASAACGRNERRLENAPLRKMSRLTERLMRGIDYEQARLRRMDNFLFLHEKLGHLNRLSVEPDSLSAPFCYPFWTAFPELRNVLIDERILVPLLWPEVLEQAPEGSLERKLALHLLPLPVDQRCGPQDMERVVRTVENFYS